MRRRPGVAGLQAHGAIASQFREVGAAAQAVEAAELADKVAAFRAHLEAFALNHRAAIQKDPTFRAQFHEMCASVGVDPLASNKGFWAELLGFGDFYYELANGGLMDISALLVAVRRRRGSVAQPVSEDDVLRAIAQLRVFGGGWDVLVAGSRRVVRSVPIELSGDQTALLSHAAAAGGWLSQADAQRATGWAGGRVAEALDAMLKSGVALVDDGAPDGRRLFWFIGIIGSGAGEQPKPRRGGDGAQQPP